MTDNTELIKRLRDCCFGEPIQEVPRSFLEELQEALEAADAENERLYKRSDYIKKQDMDRIENLSDAIENLSDALLRSKERKEKLEAADARLQECKDDCQDTIREKNAEIEDRIVEAGKYLELTREQRDRIEKLEAANFDLLEGKLAATIRDLPEWKKMAAKIKYLCDCLEEAGVDSSAAMQAEPADREQSND